MFTSKGLICFKVLSICRIALAIGNSPTFPSFWLGGADNSGARGERQAPALSILLIPGKKNGARRACPARSDDQA
jgi:hypothetical protein